MFSDFALAREAHPPSQAKQGGTTVGTKQERNLHGRSAQSAGPDEGGVNIILMTRICAAQARVFLRRNKKVRPHAG
jgi:hypothetical protein